VYCYSGRRCNYPNLWQLALPEDSAKQMPSIRELIALTDALHRGTLSPAQAVIVRSLREGLSLMAEHNKNMEDVKVQVEINTAGASAN
jgi:hypothetical protein